MLPKTYHEHDASWLSQLLFRLPPKQRDIAIKGYETAWQEAWQSEPVPHKKENRARFEANTRLRKYVARVTGVPE